MAFLRKYTNVDGDGQIVGQSPDSRGDFYDPTDKQRDFDYWQAKVGDVLRAVSKTPSTEIQILQGGEITDAGSGNVDMAEGWAIVKNAAGDERIVNRPAFSAVVFPVAFNDGRDVWVASRFEQALDAETRSHKTEITSYKFIHIDSFTGDTAFGETTNDMFFDVDPGGNYVIWDKITMTGTTFAKIAGRSQEWKPFNSIDKIEDALDVDDSGSKIVDDLLVWDGTKWKRQATGTKIFAKLKAETDIGDVKSLLNVAAGDIRYIQGVGRDPGVINGSMFNWQVNTSASPATSGQYFADMYKYEKNGPQIHTIIRSTDVPLPADGATPGLKFSLKIDVTVVNTAIDAGEVTGFSYNMEGTDFSTYFGQTFTISFMVKSNLTGQFNISFQNAALARSFVAEYTINVADEWEKKTITVLHDTEGVWNLDNALGLKIFWGLATDGPRQTTPGTWENGDFIGTAGSVNFDSDTDNELLLTDINFHLGGTARRNLKRDSDEASRISRFFIKWGGLRYGFHKDSGDESNRWSIAFPLQMRAIPTATLDNNTEVGGVAAPVVELTNIRSVTILMTSNNAVSEDVFSTFDLALDSRF